MRRLHPPLPHRDRKVIYGLGAQSLEAFDPTDDIEDGVHRSDFMQVHFFRSDAVDSTFSFAHQSERADGALLHPIGNRSPLDESHQLTDVAAVRLLRDLELDLLARNTGAPNVSNRNSDVAKAKPFRQFLEPGNRQSQREERPQRHVAADTSSWIQDSDAHVPKYWNINSLGPVEPPGACIEQHDALLGTEHAPVLERDGT